MDRLEAMAVLLAVVEAGSLSAAGRRLGMPLATVSRKLGDLEAYLAVRLVQRSTRRLALTDAGQSYVAACKGILDAVAEAERTASGEYRVPRGRLVVTAPMVFGRLHVMPAICDFLERYPEIDLRLVLADQVVRLLDDRIDLAVRIGHLPDSGLAARRLGTVGRVVCASPVYLARRGMPRTPDDLAGHDGIIFEGISGPAAWPFMVEGSERIAPVRTRLSVNTAEAAIDAALAGAGLVRVLSYQVATAVAAGRLVRLLGPFEPAPWPVSLVHGGQGPLPLKLRSFIDFAEPRLRQALVAMPPQAPPEGYL